MTQGADDRAVRPVTVIVLTGGGSRRMGAHKPSLLVGGRALVVRVLDAAHPHPTLVVGLPDDVPDGIPVIREDPPGGGPVAALAAAVEHLSATTPAPRLVAVLAADLPFVTSGHLDRLIDALGRTPDAGLAVTTDRAGQPNWLCAAWRFPTLVGRLEDMADGQAAARGHVGGRSLRELATGVPRVEIVDETDLATDVDTPEELEAARRREAAGQGVDDSRL
ncbi:molybdenum cofactor guanylyltransferase [Intrasporangium mesophilum]